MNVLVLSAHTLKPIAQWVARVLPDAGVGIWIDFAMTDQYEAQISSYMRESELVLLLVDAEYFSKGSLPTDWQAAREVETPKLVLAFGEFELPEHDRTFTIERPRDHDDAASIVEGYVRAQLLLSCFVSYAHADFQDADSLVRSLSSSRARVWIDRSGIPPGAHFPDSIYGAIEKAEWFFLLWSVRSKTSLWVRREWTHAIQHDKRIVPILLDVTPLPPELETFHGFHSTGDQRFRDYFQLWLD